MAIEIVENLKVISIVQVNFFGFFGLKLSKLSANFMDFINHFHFLIAFRDFFGFVDTFNIHFISYEKKVQRAK